MKSIKFRGRDKSGKWFYGSYVKVTRPVSMIDESSAAPFRHFIVEEDATATEVEAETVTQFIGTYDHNGTPIYEGDIIVGINDKSDTWTIIVAFSDECSCYDGYRAYRDLSVIGDPETMEYFYFPLPHDSQWRLSDAMVSGNLWDVAEPKTFESTCLRVDTFAEFRKYFQES